MREEDGRLGARAVERGWVSAQGLEEALALFEERRRAGEGLGLGRHMVESGLLSAEQVRELLADQGKEILVCSNAACAKRYNVKAYRAGGTYACKECGARLAVPVEGRRTLLEVDAESGASGMFPLPAVAPAEPLAVEAAPTTREEVDLTVLDEVRRRTGREVAIRLGGTPRPSGKGPFGRYQDARELARGGMGAILRAIDPELGRPVAIKVILTGDWAASEELSRFLREAQITGQLQHPNIPPVHELARTPDGRIYFTMKLIEGESLASVVAAVAKEGPGALARERNRLLGALVRVCEGLAYAHSRGVVHRDLKPPNIMMGAFGEVLVMDWGIARILGTSDVEVGAARAQKVDPLRTMEGAMMGTPAYMSPEQVDGKRVQIFWIDDSSLRINYLYHFPLAKLSFPGYV